jgi:hypothetical protein
VGTMKSQSIHFPGKPLAIIGGEERCEQIEVSGSFR